jgi:nitrous oxidase accessory protein
MILLRALTGGSNTIVVAKGSPLNTLTEANKLAKNGDTILLNKGVYRERTITITKTLYLLGIDQPVLDGEGKYEILVISGKNIVIKGIHFANAGYSAMNDYAAIKIVDARGIVIDQNIITNASFAIHISNSTNCIIRRNSIKGSNKSEHSSGNGIHMWKCDQMKIENNSISGHRDGIYLEFVTQSEIKNNRSEKNIRYGLHFMFSHEDVYTGNSFISNGAGVAVMYSKKVRMTQNHFEQNWGASAYGILLKDITDSHVSQNTFFRYTVAIHMEGSSRIEISKNIFKENGWAIKVQSSCDDNNFHHNNFYGNSFDLATNGTMVLNRFYNNYWDNYDGYDINRDGIGDVPYHPLSMYSMIVEENPNALILFRSFTMQLLDKAEKAIPSLTPDDLVDKLPLMKSVKL